MAEEVLITTEWADAAGTITSGAAAGPPVVVICGPKNSGKSTFSRYLLNTLLQRYEKVGYLDLDVGQSEFGLPGVLSLHIVDEFVADMSSPSYKEPERSFFYGDISSKRDPEAYTSYACYLYDYFVKEYRQFESHKKPKLPLIVNTPGWVKGTGFELLVDMLKYIAPTHVVQLHISNERKNLPSGPFWLVDEEDSGSGELIYISSARKDSFNRSLLIQKDARGARDRRLFEYFRQCFPEKLNISSYKELAYALASLPPYVVSLSSIKVLQLHCQVPKSEIFHSLNATIVGLAVSSGLEVSQDCRYWCAGLGIVRAADARRGLLYVITPVSHSTLEKVDVLLRGFIEIPTALLQTVNVTPEEREAIERLEAMGFDRALVLEVFFACNKNEKLAANYLLDHMHEFEEC